MEKKKEIVALSKCDALDEATIAERREILKKAARKAPLVVSSLVGQIGLGPAQRDLDAVQQAAGTVAYGDGHRRLVRQPRPAAFGPDPALPFGAGRPAHAPRAPSCQESNGLRRRFDHRRRSVRSLNLDLADRTSG